MASTCGNAQNRRAVTKAGGWEAATRLPHESDVVTTRPAPAALERTNDLPGDPTAVEAPFLEGHLLAVDLRERVQRQVEGERPDR